MNSYEAKRGFFTFLTLTLTVVGMSFFVNYILTQNTRSETQASSSALSFLPSSDLLFLVGIPVLILGIIITTIKRIKSKKL